MSAKQLRRELDRQDSESKNNYTSTLSSMQSDADISYEVQLLWDLLDKDENGNLAYNGYEQLCQ